MTYITDEEFTVISIIVGKSIKENDSPLTYTYARGSKVSKDGAFRITMRSLVNRNIIETIPSRDMVKLTYIGLSAFTQYKSANIVLDI